MNIGVLIASIVIAVLVILILTVLVRTFQFVPREEEKVEEGNIQTNRKKIVDDMVSMIQCRTVSNRDESLVDRTQFEKFEKLLPECFPHIYEKCEFNKVGKTGLVFLLKGKSDKKPSVCMAHYDVVPVEEEGWDKPAFDGIIENDILWGRGTLDTKGTLCGILEATEQLLSEGFTPNNDLYFSFSGEEEIDGDTCPDIVKYLEEKGVKPAIVLDEGGAVVENTFPGVTRECAAVGTGEKGSVNMDFVIESNGGHASAPPTHSILSSLSEAIIKIESHPFKYQITPPVKEMFDEMGRYSTFFYRMLFANMWCFAPLLNIICKKSGGELNALLRTTIAVTRAEGSKAYNVMPSKASFGINMRLIGTDTIDSATEYLNQVIGDNRIKPSFVNGMNPSICSDTSCTEWNLLKIAINQTWPTAIVAPYMMLACSDSRHYCRITDRVYRFSAMKLSKEERAMIHGNNERIPIDTLIKTVEFYIRFIRSL